VYVELTLRMMVRVDAGRRRDGTWPSPAVVDQSEGRMVWLTTSGMR